MFKVKHINIIFVISTFMLTWMIWIFGYLFVTNHISLFIAIATCIPSLVGLLMLYMLGKNKLIDTLKSAVSFKISLKLLEGYKLMDTIKIDTSLSEIDEVANEILKFIDVYG